jgi:hypothetical protein
VYFLGGAVSIHSSKEWAEVLTVVRGTIYNGFSKNDYILHLYRASVYKIPIGRIPLFEIDNPHKMTKAKEKLKKVLEEKREGLRIKNVNLTKVARGHLSYRAQLVNVLEEVQFNA